MSTEAVHLAAGIKRTCREWFDANLKEDRAELVPNVWMFVLYSELTQVEMQLFMEAVANPADPQVLLQHELQHRGKRIAAIDEIIRKYPDLEKKLRPDLDHLWKIYR